MRIMTAFAMLAVLGAVLIAPVAARADDTLQANIPFEFVAGSVILPPGNYQFEASHYGHMVAIWSVDQKTRSLVLANRAYQSTSAHSPARLVFNKYGNRYFLSEIWGGVQDAGQRLPKTRQEREASLTARAQPIMVAAR